MTITDSAAAETDVPCWPGRAGDAIQISQSIELSGTGRSMLTPSQNMAESIHMLRRNGRIDDAITLLAHWMPRRLGVWWACRCACRAAGTNQDVPDTALAAAQDWAREPTEEHRRAAGDAAEAADYETPGALAALAAFWSGGSMAPPEVDAVPAPAHLCPGAIISAVRLAAVSGDWPDVSESLERFLELGLAVARGDDMPTPPTPPTPPAPALQ